MCEGRKRRNKAFVLKKSSSHINKVALLHVKLGRIYCTAVDSTKLERLSAGMLIESDIQLLSSVNGMYCMSDVDILFSPSAAGIFTLHWYHCLLELCYYATSLHTPCRDVYYALSVLIIFFRSISVHRLQTVSESLLHQVGCLYLLYRFGLHYPEQCHALMTIFDAMTDHFAEYGLIDYDEWETVFLSALHTLGKKDFSAWISACLQEQSLLKVCKVNSMKW